MSAVEYVVIFTSIVLGLALSAVLMNFDRLLRAGRRVRWHWASPVTAVLVVLLLIQIWWSLFPDQENAVRSIGAFLPQLVLLILLYLLASAVFPAEIPDEGMDLGRYYDRTSAYFWALMTASLAWAALTPVVVLAVQGGPLAAYLQNRLVDFVVLLLFASLIFVRARWWHAIVIVVAMIGPVGWLSRSLV